MTPAHPSTGEPHGPRVLGASSETLIYVAIALLIAAFVVGALDDSDGISATWLPIAVSLCALAGCVIRLGTVPEDRAAWSTLAAAIGVWTLGSISSALASNGLEATSSPTFADACHVAFYPLCFLGMLQLVRSRMPRFASARWLDGPIGALAVASIAAGIVLPLALHSAGDRLSDLVVQAVFPVGDMLLLTFVAGVMALNRWRPDRAWIVFGAAFGTLAFAHALELWHTATGVREDGVVGLLWPIGIGLLALAGWHASDLRPMIRGEPTLRENASIARESRQDIAHSTPDTLTGLANHRAFHEALRREVSHARRHHRELSIVIIDIDDFRHVNQTHGHHVGDGVLIEVAARIAGTLRSNDVLARIGGEEFACLLPSTDGRAGWRAAERARQAIEAAPFGGVGQVTISAGVCDLEVTDDEDELVRLADGALYWAKNHGRNVVYRYQPGVMDVLSAEDRAEQAERSRTLSAITALARAVDAKDATTQRHSERVAAVAAALAGLLGWTPERRINLHEAGLVHDVGKIGVPDSILRKRGPMTPDEVVVMKTHAALGARIVQDVLSPEQALWVLHHHERWDGAGYPQGVAGESIPEGAQILAVADAWDAMTATRHYRSSLAIEHVLRELDAGKANQWSPRVIDALFALWSAGSLVPAFVAEGQPLPLTAPRRHAPTFGRKPGRELTAAHESPVAVEA